MVASLKISSNTQITFSKKLESDILSASNQWRRLKGSSYGLRLPPMVGFLAVRNTSLGALVTFDQWLSEVSHYDGVLEGYELSPEGLVNCILSWFVRIQQMARIPLFEGARILSSDSIKAPNHIIFEVALPCFSPSANMQLLAWLTTTFNQFGSLSAANSLTDFALILKRLSQFKVSGVNAYHFLDAANAMQIPVRMLGAGIYCYGNGATSQWLQSTITQSTSCLGVQIAKDKFHTAHILASAGIPVSPHMLVKSSEDACKAANRLGYPVVVKPVDLEQGEGVSANIKDENSLLKAYSRAAKLSKRVMVEKHFFGDDYRLTVFNGKVIKVERRIPAGILGDGVSTVEQLVSYLQQTPRFQKALRDFGKMMISLDDEANELLAEAGFSPETILAKEKFLCLRKKSNISTGGTQELIPLNEVHCDNLSLAERAALATNLDIAGIDLLIPNIRQSWLRSGAVICEVNSQPQIGKKTTPNIYRDILSDLMRKGDRIPVHLVLQSKTAGSELEMERGRFILKNYGLNGLSTSTGLWIDSELIVDKPADSFNAAEMLLSNKSVGGAVCVLNIEDLLQYGLPCDWFESITVFHDGLGALNNTIKQRLELLLLGHTKTLEWKQAAI